MNKPPTTKAVIAAAGFGTRFLPQTKAVPKEMLPLVDKPVLQHIVEEVVGAGIKDIIIVTVDSKRAIEDHFSEANVELTANLRAGGKGHLLREANKLSKLANFTFVKQHGTYGNAAPLISARHLIEREPFIYAFADDFVVATPTRFQQLIATHQTYGGTVLTGVVRNKHEDYARYGFVGGEAIGDNVIAVDTIIEKPGNAATSPSNLASVSGYIIDPVIFEYLDRIKSELKPGEEFAIQSAMQLMIRDGHGVFTRQISNGVFYDTGNKLEYVKAVIDFALIHPEIGEEFRAYLNDMRVTAPRNIRSAVIRRPRKAQAKQPTRV
ncbi:MAG TPA: sugar phosphate nucleotidyltransferase [Candidatus Saccharimonadales bacterium]|nr:sugar phosphate nucleotidyltransferase [Candidatus Saccharimonadales bacterium]